MFLSNPEVIAGILAIAGSGGAAWAGVKASLNGTRERVVRIEKRQDLMDSKMDDIRGSLIRLETVHALNVVENPK